MELSRAEIFAQAAAKLRQDFDESRLVPHQGARAGEAEKLVKDFLRRHLPKRFDVGSGFIIDRQDTVSRQTDVVIYDAMNCPVYRPPRTRAIFPSNNVAALRVLVGSADETLGLQDVERLILPGASINNDGFTKAEVVRTGEDEATFHHGLLH